MWNPAEAQRNLYRMGNPPLPPPPPPSPLRQAQLDYVADLIDVDELELRVEAALTGRGEPMSPPPEPTDAMSSVVAPRARS